jgi:hypothetical protein
MWKWRSVELYKSMVGLQVESELKDKYQSWKWFP